jgi:hypothetical protein
MGGICSKIQKSFKYLQMIELKRRQDSQTLISKLDSDETVLDYQTVFIRKQ